MSACLVAATAGCLGVNALSAKRTPPELRVFTGSPSAHADGHRVPVLVRNEGDATGESVRIEVVLRRGAEEVARAELDRRSARL